VICSNIAVCGEKADAGVSDTLEQSQRGGLGVQRGEFGHFTDLVGVFSQCVGRTLHRLWVSIDFIQTRIEIFPWSGLVFFFLVFVFDCLGVKVREHRALPSRNEREADETQKTGRKPFR
jgi:hypothetical protein